MLMTIFLVLGCVAFAIFIAKATPTMVWAFAGAFAVAMLVLGNWEIADRVGGAMLAATCFALIASRARANAEREAARREAPTP